METLTVDVRRVEPGPEPDRGPRPMFSYASVEDELDADLARARWLARLLDSQFNFMGIEFGLDAIAGLVPVVGDCAAAVAALYPVHVARKHNLGKTLQARMAFNVLMDFAAGAVPVIGDLVDVAYKANLKNLSLLEKAVEKRRRR
jgi:hypothetical protein